MSLNAGFILQPITMLIRTLISGLFLWLASAGGVHAQNNPAQGGAISDGDFAAWTPFHFITDDPFLAGTPPNVSTGRVERLAGGGNPGAHLRFTHAFTSGDTSWIGAMKDDYSFDPREKSEVLSLTVNADVNFLNFGGVSWQLVVEQDGKKYFTVPWEQAGSGLQTVKLRDLTPKDFDTNPWADYSSSGVQRDGNQPDFSSNAAPMKFGFMFGNHVPGQDKRTLTAAVTLDNFKVVIAPVPPPPPPVVVVAPVQEVAAIPPPQPQVVQPIEPVKEAINWKVVGLIALAVLILIAAAIIKPFNDLIVLRNLTKKAWADIDVQLKRRHDLILNYVETVKGYAKHERGTLEGVTQARAAAVNAGSIGERAQAEQVLNATMRTLIAVAETYPDLKANQNFQSLNHNMTDTEGKIEKVREKYNDVIFRYNTEIQQFPRNIIAKIFRFTEREFFEFKGEAEREAPKVAF